MPDPTDPTATSPTPEPFDVAVFDDIPGTRVFTAARSRQGYQLNQFCMSLMKAENRARFHADEAAYLAEWPMTQDQRDAVMARDFDRMMELGGNVYFLSKIFASDGLSYVQAVSTMTDLNVEQYQQMLLDGGRNIEGWRSVAENEARARATADTTEG